MGQTCVKECQEGFYGFAGFCVKCQDGVSGCYYYDANATIIITRCKKGLYLFQNGCVKNCPNGTFASNGVCKSCKQVECEICIDGTYEGCIKCNTYEGYIMSPVRMCVPMACPEGTYFAPASSKPHCKPCNEACLTCTGPTSENCLECAQGYAQTNPFECKKCEEIYPGTQWNEDNKCSEICGDGINLGAFECDDGNLLNGDGCSSECRVEPGFACRRNIGGRSMCYPNTPLVARLSIINSNKAAILSFNRKILFVENMTESIETKFVGMVKDCQATVHPFEPKPEINEFLINLSIKCSIRGGQERLLVIFNDPGLFVDKNGVPLTTTTLSAKLTKNYYMDETQKAVVAATGSSFEATNYLLFAVSLGQFLFQSIALGSVWGLLNMLQILYYLPVIDLYIPPNLYDFLINYLTIANLKLPSGLFPQIIPKKWEQTLTDHFDSSLLREFGVDSYSFIYNFGFTLITWLALSIGYVILIVLDKLLPEDRFMFIRRWKAEYTYNLVIRTLLETYLDMTFSGFLNVFMVLFYIMVNYSWTVGILYQHFRIALLPFLSLYRQLLWQFVPILHCVCRRSTVIRNLPKNTHQSLKSLTPPTLSVADFTAFSFCGDLRLFPFQSF
eukprot:TRINITY_DN994_c0_g1_i1.p1 TRINITY_DN994_c0_g1~~TRINITY_DN994_c0_g1_i1.p1  ORF type:complete len:617 (+),score=12.97 TRINITY_DN994_c0_g1_i1:1501-3351(+)